MRKAILIILMLAGFASGAEMEVTDRLSVDGSSLFKSTAVFSGSVGIGTTGPGAKLQVNSSGDASTELARFVAPDLATNSNNGYITVGKAFVAGQGAAFGYTYNSNSALAGSWITNLGDVVSNGLFVQKGGSVGIGTTLPAQKLDVAGNISATVLYQGGNQVLDTSMLDSFTLKLDTTTNKIKFADRIEQNIMLDAFKIAVSSSLSKFNMVDGIMDEFEDESGVDKINSSSPTYNSAGRYYSPLVSIGGIDSYTKLMFHFNSLINGSKEIQDSGNTGYIVTQVGTAALTTAQKKIGNCSLLLNGISDYLTVPYSDDWNFGSGDFTVDCWVYINTAPPTDGTYCIVGFSETGNDNRSWSFDYRDSGGTKYLKFSYSTNGQSNGNKQLSVTATLNTGTWYHLAFARSSNTLYIFINGVSQTVSGSFGSDAFYAAATVLTVGATKSAAMDYFNGCIDEVRVSKGIARWTSGFTAQTTPYTSDNNTKLLLHMESLDVSSTAPKIPAFVSTAHLDTAQKVFGSASIRLNGSSDYVTVPDSDDWYFGTGDFTLDYWVRFSAFNNFNVMSCQVDAANNNRVRTWYNNSTNQLYFDMSISGDYGTGLQLYCPFSPSVNTWHHLAFTRESTADTVASWGIYIDGTRQTLTKNAGIYTPTLPNIDGPLVIGNDTVNAYYLNGWIDEFRITKGTARWTANFTPPVSEYSTTNLTYNMSLKSNSTTAVATPSNARVVLFEEDVDTCALNTDIKASVSRDNGTTYSTATLADDGDWSAGKRILSGIVDISAQPSGTNMKWRVDTSNNRDMKLHGVGLNWD